MPTQSEIAKDWGVSKVYIHKCVAKGCPLNSYEDARLWREAHARKRQTTSPAQLARLLAEKADDDSMATGERRKKYCEDKRDRVRFPTEDNLDEALHDAIEAAREASRLLREAMLEGKDQKISVRVSVFNKASENRFKAEQAYREEQERRGILIPLTVAQDMARHSLGVIIARLRNLPQNVGARCNPANAHQAMGILEAECEEILADARRAIAADTI
jgi:hypothetical protein